MSNEYNISIKAIIDLDGTTTQSANPNNYQASKDATNSGSSEQINKGNSLDVLARLSGLRYGARQANKLVSAFGNDQMKNISQKISKAMMYTTKAAMAFSTMNPIEIADLTLDIVCDIGQQVRQQQQKQASINNEQDLARINAGLYNVEGTSLKIDGFSGRYSFKRSN